MKIYFYLEDNNLKNIASSREKTHEITDEGVGSFFKTDRQYRQS